MRPDTQHLDVVLHELRELITWWVGASRWHQVLVAFVYFILVCVLTGGIAACFRGRGK